MDNVKREPVRVVAAVIERDGRVLIARRIRGGIGGDWEFPGGKVQEGEEPERALERELAEELGVKSCAGDYFCTVPYRDGEKAIDLLVYRADFAGETWTLTDHEEVRWTTVTELDEAAFSEPDRPVVRLLLADKTGDIS